MITGCTNPNAVNYNPAARVDDYSCLYLIKKDEECHLFQDVVPGEMVDKSFTLSYSAKGQSWVFFHDYFPDMYIHSRENLFSTKDNDIHKHNVGAVGDYYSTTRDRMPFFIDVIFRAEQDLLLESVQWVTEYLTPKTDQPFNTLTHLSIWNSTQHSGRIELSQLFEALNYDNIRRTKGEWSINDFRDVLKTNPGTFLKDIFDNFSLDLTKVEANPAFYEQGHLQDSWFCIRFEFDNLTDAKLILHNTNIQALKTDR